MSKREAANAFDPRTSVLLAGALGVAAAGLVAATTLIVGPQRAEALPAYAQQTKLACGSCHVSPSGGGELKPLGKKFQANGHKLK